MSGDFFQTINGPNVAKFRNSAGVESTVPFQTKIIEIGDWNMNFSGSGIQSVTINHGLGDKDLIKSVDVYIRGDAGTTNWYSFLGRANTSGVVDASISGVNNTTIGLSLTNSSQFDSSVFDSTSYNRGWIIVEYIPA